MLMVYKVMAKNRSSYVPDQIIYMTKEDYNRDRSNKASSPYLTLKIIEKREQDRLTRPSIDDWDNDKNKKYTPPYKMEDEGCNIWGVVDSKGKRVLTGESYTVASNLEYNLNNPDIFEPTETYEIAERIRNAIMPDNTPIIDGVRERKDMVRKRLLDKFTERRMDEPEENKVATIILSQLGGNKFITMTGAKDLVDGGNYLMFTLRRGTAKDGINKVRITLEPSDTYKVEFMKINYKTLDVKTVKEYDDIYADQLVEIFESTTGLYTHL